MIKPKTPKEIAIMRQGGQILARVLALVAKKAKPGASTEDLTNYAEGLIKKAGGSPSFKGYKAAWADNVYPAALCVSINQEVVHGLPVPDRRLKNGDIVGLDCGLKYQGLYTDAALTVGVGQVSAAAKKLMRVTQEALYLGIKQAKAGRELFDISRAIEKHVKKNGLAVVRQLVGHGVGYSAHEDPQIPNYESKEFKNIKLVKGMTLALEPMVNAGGWEVESLADGWTIVTADHSLSAHFEHTIAVGDRGGEILTK